MAKSIFDSYTNEQLQDIVDNAEVTPAGSIIFEERFINPKAVDVEFTYDWNAQPREVTDGRGLVDSICRVGLNEKPMLVIYGGKDLPEVAKGHRRLDACCIISAERANDFKRNFPNGVPVKVATGKVIAGEVMPLTHIDMHLLRADHDLDSLKQSLATKIECVRLTRPLFESGMKGPAVQLHTWRTVSRIMSTKYADLCKSMDNALPHEQVKILDNSQHGNYQLLKAIADSPMALYEAWAIGERKEGPVLTQKQVKELASQFRKDKSDALSIVGGPVVDKDNPSPEWTSALADAITESAKPKEETDKGPKMVKKSKVEEMLEKAKSMTQRLTLQAVLGIAGADRMLQNSYDGPVRGFEDLRESKPRLIEMLLELASSIDEDVTKEQYKAVNAVFQSEVKEKPESVHKHAAEEASPKAKGKKAKGEKDVAAKS